MAKNENNEIKHPRRMPTEGAFMSFKIDDIIYGYLQGIATYNPEVKMVYLSEVDFLEAKRVLKDLLGTCARTISRKIDILTENDLLKYDKDKKIYYFPYNKDEKYCIVSADLLKELTSVYNHMAVRVYVYLLDKYIWKQKNEENYDFTIKELKAAFGYSVSTKGHGSKARGTNQIDEVLKNVLNNLAYNHYIEWEAYYDMEHSAHPVPRMRLLSVARSLKDKGQVFHQEVSSSGYECMEDSEFKALLSGIGKK